MYSSVGGSATIIDKWTPNSDGSLEHRREITIDPSTEGAKKGAAAGAGIGAATGGLVGGPVGAAIGAAIGTAVGGIGGLIFGPPDNKE